MKYLNIIILLTVPLLASCSHKLPMNLDSNKGIAAIPIEIKNTSSESRIPFEYMFIDYKSQVVCAVIKPKNGQQFIFTEELTPGEYQLYKVKRVFSSDAGIADKQVDEKNLFTSIRFSILPGTIFISDMKFTIHQYQENDDKFYTKYDVGFLMNKEREDFVKLLESYENSQDWDIVYKN